MQNPEIDLPKQQRLLQRGISGVRARAQQAFTSGLIADFAELENSNREFKAFIAANVTAPEILGYAAQIPRIRHGSSEPGLFRIMFMPFISLISGRSVRAKAYTIDDAKEVQAMYGNLEILVGMMDEQ